MKEFSLLRADFKARNACLVTFEIRKYESQIEISKQVERIKELEDEIKILQKGMEKFVQEEEVLNFIMKQTKVLFDKEGLRMASTSKD